MHRIPDIPGPDGSSQAIDDIVSLRQHFILRFEAAHDDNRTKHLTLHNLSVVAVLCNHSRLKEEALLQTCNRGTLPARHNICSLTQGTLHKPFDGCTLGSRDQWPHIRTLPRWVANANLLHLTQERVHEGIIGAILHIHTCGSS